ncbi:restriction endonuclease subunit S [Virgibacillus salexigens]|uniref:restriction endonuclease subunit S n=1 Tax=Virgibacillus salexigens TaxID=61016 RepID=UPI0019093AEF|nr:restriction endonuclease subunit S [Virgibacillus salexigens]
MMVNETFVIKNLEDLATIKYGKNQKDVETPDGIYKILGTGGVIGYTNEFLYDKPSVLIGRKGTIDKPRFIDEPFWTVDTLFYTEINSDIVPKWLYYAIKRIDLKKYNEATGVPSLSVKNLNKIKIATPQKKVQKKIAAILTSVDEAIVKTEQIIEQISMVKIGVLKQLLTKGVGHNTYKDSPIGYIPDEWKYAKLKDLSDKITDGTHKTPKYTKSGVPFLRVTDLKNTKINFNNTKYISAEEHKELIKRCHPEKGDILLSKNGTIGLTKVIDWEEEFSIFVSLALIKLDKSIVLPKFIEYFLQSEVVWKQLRKRSKQGTVTNLHLVEIKELICGVPSIDEQEKIIHHVDSIERKIINEQSKLKKLNEIKQGLMQQLLTGKVRVSINDSEEVPS